MNLVLFLLNLLFSSYAPATQTYYNGNETGTTVTTPEPGTGKGDKFGDGDYIISDDTNP